MWLRLVILFLHLGSCLFGSPLPGAENVSIRAYTVAEGLAHDHVSRIYRDSHGFLWICTDEGLSRFDGLRFVNYTVADGLPHIHVNDIVETHGGEYWVATDGGLTLFRPADPVHRFTVFKPDGPPEGLFTNTVLEEPGGTVLLGTGAGLYRLHPKTGAFERLEYPVPAGGQSRAVHTLYLAPDQTLWIGATTGLYRRNRGGGWLRLDERDGLPLQVVHHLEPDPEGRIWVCTPHGLARLNRTTEPGRPGVDLVVTDANGLPSRDVRSILFATNGRRWVATLGGLVEWPSGPPMPSNFHIYSTVHGLTDSQVYALSADMTGDLWIGTRRGGIMRVVRRGFQTFGPSEGLITTGTDRIIEPPSGGICIAAIEDSRRALRCFDGQQFHAFLPRLPAVVTRMLPNSNHSAIFDHQGKLWISTADGLYRFPGGREMRPSSNSPDLSLPGQSRVLFEDSRRDIWITTLVDPSFGLMRWERANARLTDLTASLPDAIRRQGATALAEAPDGVLWIGLTRPGGLFRFREGRFEQVKPVLAGTVQALYRDDAGRLWIASAEGGLGRIDDPSAENVALRVYDRAHGLSSSELWCLTADRNGSIYAGSVRGVDRIDPAIDRITHFSSADGLASGDIRAALCDRNGSLWFLSNRGLSRLQPMTSGRQPPLETRINAIRVAGVPHRVSDLGQKEVPGADFRWDRNSVQIDFSALAFQSPEQIRYQFRLLGAREGWSQPSPITTVYFSSLAPGSYQFQARAINADGFAGAAPASFSFTISPPPWLRWWFQTGVAGLLVAAAYTAHRLRLKQRLALERVRSSIATDLHDDIGASLSRIAAITEAVKGRLDSSDRDSHRMLSTIAETSRESISAMSDIVWSIDPRRDDLGDVIARLRAFGSDVLEPRGIRWTCEGPPAAFDRSLSPGQRRQFFLICKEAIHNIARHSRAENVTLRIALEGNRVTCDIQDDGCGAPSVVREGLGLASMRRRAASLGGEFRISPRPQGGAQATLHFPLDS